MFDTKEMGPLATVVYWILIGAILYVAFLLIRWMVTTREGMITTLGVAGLIGIVALFDAAFGGPSAQSRTPVAPAAASTRQVAQDPNMGWHTVIRNGQICTSYHGQQFPCTPIR